jgi:hypothetical protein
MKSGVVFLFACVFNSELDWANPRQPSADTPFQKRAILSRLHNRRNDFLLLRFARV